MCNTKARVLMALAWLSIPAAATARGQRSDDGRQLVRLEATRDTWVSAVGAEADGNNGAATRVKLKSIQEMTLVDFDMAPLAGRTIKSAVMHWKIAGDEPMRRVTVSGIGAEWLEGTGSGYAIQPGGATFRRRQHPDLPWSIDGGDFTNVVLGNGGTTWRMADASPPDLDGWQRVPVDPIVLATRLAGLSEGFLVFDDTGSEWRRDGEHFTRKIFPNRFFYSREQNRASAPYLTIEPGAVDRQPPEVPTSGRVEPFTTRLPAGEAIVSWLTPPDHGPAGTIGFNASLNGKKIPRELIPLAAAPGRRVEMHLRDLHLSSGATVQLSITAVDAAGNAGPPLEFDGSVSRFAPAVLPVLAAPPAPARSGTPPPRIGEVEVAVIDELDKLNPATGALIPEQPPTYLDSNHLWNSATRTVTLRAARNEFVAFQVSLRSSRPVDLAVLRPMLEFPSQAGPAISTEIGRYYPIPTGLGPMADPIVSLDDSKGAAPPSTQIASLHVELYVPHSARGWYTPRHAHTEVTRTR